MNVAVYGSMAPDILSDEVIALISLLSSGASRLEIEADFYARLAARFVMPSECRAVDKPSADTDIIVSIGGDGTFLHAVRWQRGSCIPIAGLNGGHLGYLTGWMLADYRDFAADIFAGNYHTDLREMLEVSLPDVFAVPDDFYPYALNEVAILKESSASMISVKAATDAGYLATYDADGLICATPTGSTGYNLSVGGPIMEPHIPAWALSPVAPHSLNMRPLVISSDTTLRLDVYSRTGQALLMLDGTSLIIPATGITNTEGAESCGVMVKKAGFSQPVVRPKSGSFAGTLRTKLLWGASPISRY